MKKLIVNAGSSSLRLSIFDEDVEIAAFTISRIGEGKSEELFEFRGKKQQRKVEVYNHGEAFNIISELLITRNIILHKNEIVGVAHRVVHGGQYFSKSVIIDDIVLKKIDECSDLARLHNPINLECIISAIDIYSNIPHVAVFDTAFHATIPEINYLYALPLKYSEKYNIRKYGFHGSSHKYMSERVIEISERKLKRLITCHVGGGASIAAILDGKSINTSMGLTPLDGLVMGTRSGDIDPGAILYLLEKEGISSEKMRHILNTQSGMLGLTENTGDLRDIQEEVQKGNKKYKRALDIYISRIVRYIGGYIADLGGVDAIILTGGVLENSPSIRAEIGKKLQCFGLDFDESLNDFRSEEQLISTQASKIEFFVIPMQEEKIMNIELDRLLK